MNKEQRKKLEQLYIKLSNQIKDQPVAEMDKYIDRLVCIENKLKETD